MWRLLARGNVRHVLSLPMARHWPTARFSTLNKVYNHKTVEIKWQEQWKQSSPQHSATQPVPADGAKNPLNYYDLTMFPYPSGALHMGHVRVYTLGDCIARMKRMQGYNVLSPMGWDAFGLPAENAAVERGLQPADWTLKNIAHMKKQLLRLGTSFDWDKEVTTCLPDYYKWTQWLFLTLYKRGLAYQKESFVNWDDVDKTVLANEQVDQQGRSWRSGAIVQRRLMRQWFLRITHYAEELLSELDHLPGWPDQVKVLQRNWIGKTQLHSLDFTVEGMKGEFLRIATTRPDTLFGVTFVAVALDHPILQRLPLSADTRTRIQQLLHTHRSATEEKSTDGVSLGISVIHPFTQERLPLFAAEYVLSDYGSGAVMGVPAHDTRDAAFAKTHGLPFKTVVLPQDPSGPQGADGVFTELGVLTNSGEFSGLSSEAAQAKIMQRAQSEGKGGQQVAYRLRDWLVSRQRYWGAPIPMIHCPKCGVVPVPESDLPVLLPANVKLTGKGSPLAQTEEWVKCKCPKCQGAARRDTDTMDTFVDSSWYFARYPDSKNDKSIFDPRIANQWMPVDAYVGGIEHAILHLLYARFITKCLRDEGLLKTGEPFKRLITQGMVHGRTLRSASSGRVLMPHEVNDVNAERPIELSTQQPVHVSHEKMSKSKYNGVDPEPVMEEYGADTVRLFMLFKAPPENVVEWSIRDIQGQARWIGRLWSLVHAYAEDRQLSGASSSSSSSSSSPFSSSPADFPAYSTLSPAEHELVSFTHNTIQSVTRAMTPEIHAFNVGIAELMKLSNHLQTLSTPSPAASSSASSSSSSSTTASSSASTSLPPIARSLAYYASLRALTLMLAPMAPHLASEMWQTLVRSGPSLSCAWAGTSASESVLAQKWPQYDAAATLVRKTVTLAVMVDGRKRGTLEVPAGLDSAAIQSLVLESPIGQKWVAGKKVSRAVVAPGGGVINFALEK